MPAGVSTAGSGAAPKRSAFSMRFSISRTLVEILVELLLVAVVELALQRAGVVEHEIEDRTLLLPGGA